MIKKKIIFYILFFLMFYVGLVVESRVYYSKIDRKLGTFDLNHDGIFSPAEQTQEQQDYFNISTGTYRGMIPIAGVAMSFMATGTAFIFLEIFGYVVKYVKRSDKN